MAGNGMALPEGGAQGGSETVLSARLKRLGMYAAVAGWVLVLMIPLFFVVLAIFGEFRFSKPGDVPDHHLRLWMVMEIDERGIGMSNTSVKDREDDALQVQTRVRYFLWEGEGADEGTTYCTDYIRESADAPWQTAGVVEGACDG